MKNNQTKLWVTLLIFTLLFSLFTVYVTSKENLSVSAKSAALYEPDSDTFIYKKNFNLRLPMASTTKIMTALLALEVLDTEKTVKIDERAVGVDGSSIYLEAGEEMSVLDLVYATMLASANDAAEALAYEIAG
ncbi:MAG: D-alanyl-D-alanine carboxypeptidase, partial [Clostridia bacterium]|nr:D-alanyl-D-alanine carboxypeptidase [Clostridia bacterium]